MTGAARLRVLHVISTLLPGGTEMALLRLLQHLDRRRYDLRVACLRGEPVLAPEFEAAGFPVATIGARGPVDPAALWRLTRLVRRDRIDLVHTQMDIADYYGACAGRLGGARAVVATKQNADDFRWRRTWKRYPFLVLERIAYEAADATIVVSEGLARFLGAAEHLPRRRMVIIGNGVDPGFAARAPGREAARAAIGVERFAPVIGTVGRLAPQKGQVHLLRAFRGLIAGHPGAVLAIAGEGPERVALESEARALGIADRVLFLGQRRDVPAVLAAFDLFVLPSLWEGLPQALLEAMASGLPVVASAAVGVEDVVTDGVTGLVVQPADPERLAAAMRRLIDAPAEAARLGAAARRVAIEQFSIGAVAARVEAVYRRVLGEPAPAGDLLAAGGRP
jgi:glycosyltransferase involved in cell wall biosynthesis